MKIDDYGRAVVTCNDLAQLLYKNPDLDLTNFEVEDANEFNAGIKKTFAEFKKLKQYHPLTIDLSEFDSQNQSNWYMENSYKQMDIAQWILDQCKTEAELQRAGSELLLFQARNMFDLLKFLKYFVDTAKKNNIVWGVGRGSSVASFVLYLLGVHKINSLYYDLDITEFLK
jgi:DNA polymerase III alpha subunit